MYSAISDEQFGTLIERQRPLKELQERVADRATLLTGYASFLERRFPAAMSGDECAGCGGRGEHVREFTWRAIFHTNSSALWNAIGLIGALGGHGWTTYNYADATTYHALCSSCNRGVWLRRAAGELVEKLCFALLLITSGVLILCGAVILALLFRHPTAREITRMGGGALIGALGVWLSIAGTKFARRWAVPARIRAFIKEPFSLRQHARAS